MFSQFDKFLSHSDSLWEVTATGETHHTAWTKLQLSLGLNIVGNIGDNVSSKGRVICGYFNVGMLHITLRSRLPSLAVT